jgi:hypothetical protein
VSVFADLIASRSEQNPSFASVSLSVVTKIVDAPRAGAGALTAASANAVTRIVVARAARDRPLTGPSNPLTAVIAPSIRFPAPRC